MSTHEVRERDEERPEHGDAHHRREVVGEDARTAYWPMPGRLNTVSVMNAPPSSVAEVETEHRDDRGQRGAQSVLVDHAASRTGPWRAPSGCSPRPSSRSGCPGPSARRTPRTSATGPATGRMNSPENTAWIADSPIGMPGRRRPPQLEPEDVQEQVGEPEHRRRHPDQREHHRRPVPERSRV